MGCAELIDLAVVAENYGQMTGVLAGFAFTALVLILGRPRERRETAPRGGVPLALFVSFLALVISTLLYSVLAGDTAEEARPRAATTELVNGLVFALSVVMLLHGLGLLMREADIDRATVRVARVVTVVVFPTLGTFFVVQGASDAVAARGMLAGARCSTTMPVLGLVLTVVVTVVLALSLTEAVQRRFARFSEWAGVAAPITVLSVAVVMSMVSADINTRTASFLMSPHVLNLYLVWSAFVMTVVGLMLAAAGQAPRARAAPRGRPLTRADVASRADNHREDEAMEDFLKVASRLIAVPSTADRPDALGEALDLVLDHVGPGFVVERFASGGKPSALVRMPGPRPHFRVVLNGHLDVVPAPDEMFRPRVEGGRLYGRGAQDMKVAALVLAGVFRDLAPLLPYPVGLQLVTDEEVGGYHGTAHQIESGVSADFVVIGEQSGLRIVTESKGILQVRLHATGTAAHAAYPWLGKNALLALTAAIDRVLARYPVPAAEAWATTVTVARVETTNVAFNQVPADATAWLDIRFPPGDGDINGRGPTEVAGFLRELSGADVTVDSFGPPHRADPGTAFVRRLRAAAQEAGYTGDFLRKHGAADGRFYYAAGTDAVIFGPGGDGQHGPGEYADLSTVEPYRRALTGFLRSLA